MKRSLITLLLSACALSAVWAIAQETLPVGDPPAAAPEAPPTDARHYSYAIGQDIGASFRGDNLPLDVDSVIAGIKDGLAGADPRFPRELCGVALERLAGQRAEVVRQRSRDYLVANAKQPGVQTLPSGLQYKVLSTGEGESPGPGDIVQVHYTGALIDGTVFDSTQGGEPAELPVGRVIKGWSEALQKMKVGDKWQLVIPSELGYREEGAGGVIPPHATLVFEVELVGIAGQ